MLYYMMKRDAPADFELPADFQRIACQRGSVRSIDSATLLGSREEVEISHSGETYRLRRTRQGKLILTK